MTGERGFTFIELIMVVVILGALAVFAMPRMPNVAEFRERGFLDETRAALRLAQKSAVAANCPVNFSVTAGATGGYSAAFTCGAPAPAIASPKGDAAGLSGSVPNGVSFNAATTVTFNGAGLRTSAADPGVTTQSITINGGGGRTYVVAVHATGYVQ